MNSLFVIFVFYRALFCAVLMLILVSCRFGLFDGDNCSGSILLYYGDRNLCYVDSCMMC